MEMSYVTALTGYKKAHSEIFDPGRQASFHKNITVKMGFTEAILLNLKFWPTLYP